jgi:hypothetical protein
MPSAPRSRSATGDEGSQLNGGFGAHSGPSRSEPCMRAIRPTPTFTAANVMSGLRRFCSLMGQGGGSCRVSTPLGCLRSLRARSALDGVSWVQGGSVESAVGRWWPHATESAPSSAPSLERRSLRELDAVSCLGGDGPKPVRTQFPFRNIACMMMARRRARAIRALRIVDRLAIAKAQSLSLSWPL